MATSSLAPKRTQIFDQFSLKGKVVVITGGSRGLGFNFAHGLAQAGANIACIDIRNQPQEDFSILSSYGGKAKYYKSDVRSYEELKKTIDQIAYDFGSIDGCIPAAGIITDKPFMEHTHTDFSNTIDINVTGVFSTVQLCAGHMIKQGTGGTIVCIASTAAHKAMVPQTITAYVASKWAVRGMVKQIAGELADKKIRCNSISPGTVRTDMLEGIMKQTPGREQLFLDSNMLRRLAQPDELNAAILYLMSDASSYVTGTDFCVDGGILGLFS
ncbi:hypothetical protein B7463_g3189, partial [Scytalidium lignicola]